MNADTNRIEFGRPKDEIDWIFGENEEHPATLMILPDNTTSGVFLTDEENGRRKQELSELRGKCHAAEAMERAFRSTIAKLSEPAGISGVFITDESEVLKLRQTITELEQRLVDNHKG